MSYMYEYDKVGVFNQGLHFVSFLFKTSEPRQKEFTSNFI